VTASKIALWLGCVPPARSVRWLDGALQAAARFEGRCTVIAAGDQTWLDLAADRASRTNLPSTGVRTELQLDYLGWAQIAAALARDVGATTVLVEEASRAERWVEVAAIAELLDVAQLGHVVALAPEGEAIHATRIMGRTRQTIRVTGDAVIGVRIAGSPIDEYPTPMPTSKMSKRELAAIGLDPIVLGHRATPPRTDLEPRKTVERIAEHLVVHLAARGDR
jgi:hypothetical protein